MLKEEVASTVYTRKRKGNKIFEESYHIFQSAETEC